MAVDDVNDVFSISQQILDTLNEVYMQHQGEATPLPTRQYVGSGGGGSQPHDCEQVTVTMGQIYVGMPGSPSDVPQKCNTAPLSGVFYVEVVRKTLVESQTSRRGSVSPSPLTPEQENALARVQMQDARLMLEAGLRVGDDWLGSVADVSAGPESGGYQAMQMTVILAVP